MARCLDILGDPWALLIMREVLSGASRFDELRTVLRVADTVLSKRLAALTAAGLLEKVPYGGTSRPRFEYRPTEAGADTAAVLQALARWGARHATPRELEWTALRVYCLACGQEAAESADYCLTCRTPLQAARTGWVRPARWEETKPLAAPNT
jgi:DNA-binding HxlR family transcriptional regulator